MDNEFYLPLGPISLLVVGRVWSIELGPIAILGIGWACRFRLLGS